MDPTTRSRARDSSSMAAVAAPSSSSSYSASPRIISRRKKVIPPPRMIRTTHAHFIGLDPDDYKDARPPTLPMRLRNFLFSLFLMSFPIGIFLLSANQEPPRLRVVAAVGATPLTRQMVESLLHDESFLDVVYVVLPPEAKQEDWNDLVVPSSTRTTQLKVLQPSYDDTDTDTDTDTYYGPITSVLAVWEEEQRLQHQHDTNTNTRILYWKDSYYDHDDHDDHDLQLQLQSLVDASRQYPDAVVATSGVAHFRNHFRQVTWDYKKNQFPNLLLLQSQNQQQAAMVVTGAVCLPAGLIDLTTLPQLLRESPIDAVLVHSEELFMSALMEAQNITRWILPTTRTSSTTTTTTKNASSTYLVDARQWMEATYYLQQTLDIWKDYQFLNPSKLTRGQWEAIACEAAYEQECTTSTNDNTNNDDNDNKDDGVCHPNSQKCPRAQKILQGLSSP